MADNPKKKRKSKFLSNFIPLIILVAGLFCLYNYTNVLSKLLHKKYDITFIVDGNSYTQKVEYDTLPVFDGSLEKTPTNTIEYVFSGWKPELQKVDKDATYEAEFVSQERLYNVSISSNYAGGGTYSGTGKIYRYQSNGVVEVSVQNGYIFKGWYKNGTLISNDLSLTLENIEADTVLETKFETIKKSITYNNLKDATNTNYQEYDVTFGNFKLQNLKSNGYYFVGWYTGENGTGEKVETIDSSLLQDYVLYAHWSLKAPINLNVDGKVVKVLDSFIGDTVTLDKINTGFIPENCGMAGYSVNKWYKDSSFTQEFEFGSSLTDEITLYGEYEYLLNEIHFYPYLDEFNSAFESLSNINIDSRSKLIAWIDYVRFYDVSKKVGLKLNYCSSGAQAICNEISDAYYELIGENGYGDALSSYQTSSTFSPSAYGSIGYFYVTKSYASTEATKTADVDKTGIYEQQDYAITVLNSSKRADDFDEFKLFNVKKTIPVSTSDQMVHALMNGYNVLPVANSKAEDVYNKAKTVLIEICNDEMNDFDKLRAIYEWLILNVEYDNKALALADSGKSVIELMEYDAWYAEGVFNNGVAVCEGYAKAFLILAKLENIPTIIVSGNSHAWNKVLYNGNWYGVDATHGNPSIKNTSSSKTYEAFTYSEFMFTDSYKSSLHYTSTKYTNFKAETVFNVYDRLVYSYNLETFDLFINSKEELTFVLKYADSQAKNIESASTYVTFEFAISSSYSDYQVSMLLNQASSDSSVQATIWFTGNDSCGNKLYAVKLA